MLLNAAFHDLARLWVRGDLTGAVNGVAGDYGLIEHAFDARWGFVGDDGFLDGGHDGVQGLLLE